MFYFKSDHFPNEWGPLTNNWWESIFQSGRQKMKRVERFFKGLWQRGPGGRNQQSQGQIGLNIEYPLAVLEIPDLVFLDWIILLINCTTVVQIPLVSLYVLPQRWQNSKLLKCRFHSPLSAMFAIISSFWGHFKPSYLN